MKTTLVIMAAGIGARYGAGIKQLAKMTKCGDTIIDFSIYDAKEAGFDKVVFIIRKDIEKDFREVIGDRVRDFIDIEYVFQDINDLPDGFEVPIGRTKPWGTVHAVLAAREAIDGPFLVINADDYYGKESFKKMHDFLVSEKEDIEKIQMAMAGYKIMNTLSEHGAVTRGICVGNDDDTLARIIETKGIIKANDELICESADSKEFLNEDTLVSMNMWAAYPDFIEYAKNSFKEVLEKNQENLTTFEYLIPQMVDQMLKNDEVVVKIVPTDDEWIGITFKEDLEKAQESFGAMIENKKYPESLWEFYIAATIMFQ